MPNIHPWKIGINPPIKPIITKIIPNVILAVRFITESDIPGHCQLHYQKYRLILPTSVLQENYAPIHLLGTQLMLPGLNPLPAHIL